LAFLAPVATSGKACFATLPGHYKEDAILIRSQKGAFAAFLVVRNRPNVKRPAAAASNTGCVVGSNGYTSFATKTNKCATTRRNAGRSALSSRKARLVGRFIKNNAPWKNSL